MTWYRGKKAYITGGSSGIGKAMAIELARRGASVFISARGEGRLQEALEEIKAAAASTDQVFASAVVDVSDRQQVEVVAAQVLEGLGGLDLLVNNAGVSQVDLLENTTADDYRRMMDINYFGTVWTTSAFLPHFREQRAGVIAAVSSTLGMVGLYGYSAYAASKHAVTGYCDCLRQDLLKYGVQISVLFPADTDTPQFHEENRNKPAETKAVAGTASLVSPELVAKVFLDGVAAGEYQIIPGVANKLVLWSAHKIPWAMRWVIDRDLRKFWRGAPSAGEA